MPKAKNKIRWHVKNEERKRALELGEDMLDKEFRKSGYSLSKQKKNAQKEEYLRQLGANDMDDLFVRVGYGKITPKQVIEIFVPESKSPEEDPLSAQTEDESFVQKVFRSAKKKRKSRPSIPSTFTVFDKGDSDKRKRRRRCPRDRYVRRH